MGGARRRRAARRVRGQLMAGLGEGRRRIRRVSSGTPDQDRAGQLHQALPIEELIGRLI